MSERELRITELIYIERKRTKERSGETETENVLRNRDNEEKYDIKRKHKYI